MNRTSALSVPAHVPRALVVDYDIYNMPADLGIDPQQQWRLFQGRGPLVFSPYNGGHWIATVGSDVFKFFCDPATFSSAQVSIPTAPPGDVMLPIQVDAPLHGKHRANIQSLFSPAAVAALDPNIRALVIELIEGFRAKGACEFVQDFALQFPLVIFLRMLDLPLDDRLYLRQIIEAFHFVGNAEVRDKAHRDMHAYLAAWVDKRIANPGDDAITHVTRGTIDGRPYTKAEMISTLVLLLHAGLDTVANTLAFVTYHLARHPADRIYVRNNQDKMHAIIQEFLRRYPGPNMARVLAKDYTYKGVTMKKGDVMMLTQAFFNLDADAFPNSDSVDFSREARHITFGAGPHTCAGALLARRELAIFLEEWLKHIPEFTLDPARPPKFLMSQANGMMELWLRWSVA